MGGNGTLIFVAVFVGVIGKVMRTEPSDGNAFTIHLGTIRKTESVR